MAAPTEASPPPSTIPSDGPKVPHRWRNLVTVTGAEVVDNTEAGLLSTLFPSIAASLRLDNGHLGLLTALGKFAAVPFGPMWVWIADRIGRKQALVLNNVIGGLLGIAAGTSQDFLMLLVFNTLLAGTVGSGQPLTNSIIADSFDEKTRARATGYYYGILTGVSSFIGPLLALFSGSPDGWRWGMWVIGGICLLSSVVIAVLYVEPGVGASEAALADLDKAKRTSKVTLSGVMSLFRIPTFSLMMLSRLLSGHLLISVFGIQFLVTERDFSNAVAATVLIPFGLGYVLSTFLSGYAVGMLDRLMPWQGRVAFLQSAQILFGLAAFFGTQFDWGSIGVYAAFWALLGAFQGMNPPVNRPIIMSITLPELRGQAFAIFLTFFQTIAWAMFSLSAGDLADALSIQGVFFWILFVMMIVNGLLLTPLYWTYKRDAGAVASALAHRRASADTEESAA